MKSSLAGLLPALCVVLPLAGQTGEAPPKFAAAIVRVSPKSRNEFLRTSPVRGGRYEVKQATMVDLIHLAYDIDPDKVLGGPSWLEMDRYDVIAKLPSGSAPDAWKAMLQALLADRFKLAIHNETKPLPTYALVAGKKPQLKPAEGTEESGCKPQAQGSGGGEGRINLMMSNSDGVVTSFVLGPGGTIQYACRNMTMAAFAANLRSMFGAGQSLGLNPILDETGLKGGWNFDVRWSIGLGLPMNNQGERITVFEAVDKQLGLKLEERQVPTPVMVVDSVNQKPSEDPSGTAELLPIAPAPKEFEVASVKPADGVARGGRAMQFRPLSGGRFTANGLPLQFLVSQAFPDYSQDQIIGLPSSVASERFDIIAKAPGDGPDSQDIDREALAPMLRSLLAERFKMTYHTEERQLPAYVLTAGKPKMKKADPASRSYCKNKPPAPGAPSGARTLVCQNVTMAEFVDNLQYISPEVNSPVTDATGLDGSWDFTLTYTMNFFFAARRGGDGPGPGGPGGADAPPDPSGGMTAFEAIDKELGLKLEKQKRTLPVVVIDHIEGKPTDN